MNHWPSTHKNLPNLIAKNLPKFNQKSNSNKSSEITKIVGVNFWGENPGNFSRGPEVVTNARPSTNCWPGQENGDRTHCQLNPPPPPRRHRALLSHPFSKTSPTSAPSSRLLLRLSECESYSATPLSRSTVRLRVDGSQRGYYDLFETQTFPNFCRFSWN